MNGSPSPLKAYAEDRASDWNPSALEFSVGAIFFGHTRSVGRLVEILKSVSTSSMLHVDDFNTSQREGLFHRFISSQMMGDSRDGLERTSTASFPPLTHRFM